MEKRLFQFFVGLVALVVIFKVWAPFWKGDLNEAVDPGSTEKIVVDIERGSSAETIANELKSQDVIQRKVSFLRTVRSEGLDASLRYGHFVLSPGMTLREVITILSTQGSGELAVTFPEGSTIEQMDARLTELGLIKAGDFKLCAENCKIEEEWLPADRSSLEGYLFPDTYFVNEASFNIEDFMSTLLNNFHTRTENFAAELSASGRTLNQVVIVASMLEREVKTQEDLAKVSGIIWKRLDNDWTLGIDATLLYKDADGKLTFEDLAADTAYNTRVHKGLPPSAIGNPGLATLEAALHPETSDAWFYLTDPETDAVIYGKTNEEHEANKAEYLN